MSSPELPGCCTRADFTAVYGSIGPVSMAISLRGEIDVDCADHVGHLVSRALEAGAVTRLVVDLGRVTFLGSAAIEALADAWASASAVGCRLALTRPGPNVHRILKAAGLLELFGLPATTPGLSSAAAFRSAPRQG
jgi:anti-anti-sigma factor